MKHAPLLKEQFRMASGWINHYHYRFGQYHTGLWTHPTEEAADEWRETYFQRCKFDLQVQQMTTFFHIPSQTTEFDACPSETARRDPAKGFFDDCILHYATPEGP